MKVICDSVISLITTFQQIKELADKSVYNVRQLFEILQAIYLKHPDILNKSQLQVQAKFNLNGIDLFSLSIVSNIWIWAWSNEQTSLFFTDHYWIKKHEQRVLKFPTASYSYNKVISMITRKVFEKYLFWYLKPCFYITNWASLKAHLSHLKKIELL